MQGPSSASGSSPSPNEIVAEGRNFKRVGMFDELMVGRYYFLIGSGNKVLVAVTGKGFDAPFGENVVNIVIYKTWARDHWVDVAGDRNPMFLRQSQFDAGLVKMYYKEQRGAVGGRRKTRRRQKRGSRRV